MNLNFYLKRNLLIQNFWIIFNDEISIFFYRGTTGEDSSSVEVKETVKDESPKKLLRVERKLSTEEEIAMVRKMSNEDAWSHVMTQVFEVCSFNVLLIAT